MMLYFTMLGYFCVKGGDILELRKKVILIIIAVIALLAFLAYWNVFRFERVRVSGGQRLLAEYSDYYYKAVFRTNRAGSLFGASWYNVYFLRGQRVGMVERIREDILAELEMFVEEYADAFYRYEISNDLRQVWIYETSDDWRTIVGEVTTIHITSSTTRIQSLMGLYQNIKEERSTPAHFTHGEGVIILSREAPPNTDVGWFLNLLRRWF